MPWLLLAREDATHLSCPVRARATKTFEEQDAARRWQYASFGTIAPRTSTPTLGTRRRRPRCGPQFRPRLPQPLHGPPVVARAWGAPALECKTQRVVG